jgi:tetratricopeptide (TPR) repeat protein
VLNTEIDAFIKSITFHENIRSQLSIGPLIGRYASDKFVFFPAGRDRSNEKLFMSALKEGGCENAEVYTQSPAAEQLLAMEYDVAWFVSGYEEVIQDLGCVLGKVGRWKEAFEAFQAVSKNNPESATIMGNLGVGASAIGKYNESVEYFSKAQTLEPEYFKNKVSQKKIFKASNKAK